MMTKMREIKEMLDGKYLPLTFIVRLMAGTIFISEGILKLVFPATKGATRFEKICLPAWLGPVLGTIETVAGTLVLLGLITRLAVIPLLLIVIGSFALTKTMILTEDGWGNFLHESRVDWSMLLANAYLLLSGSGKWSLDNLWAHRKNVATSLQ